METSETSLVPPKFAYTHKHTLSVSIYPRDIVWQFDKLVLDFVFSVSFRYRLCISVSKVLLEEEYIYYYTHLELKVVA